MDFELVSQSEQGRLGMGDVYLNGSRLSEFEITNVRAGEHE